MKNIGTVSHPEVISQSFQLHFVKYHSKESFFKTLMCYTMALLFPEMLSYCSMRKVSVSNKGFLSCFVLIGSKHFEIGVFGLTLLLILNMDVNSHVKSVMKVVFREQINYM